MSHAEPTPAFEFDCPLCGGAFEADLAMLGQEVECPHCGQVVELPATSELDAGSPVDPADQPQAGPPAVKKPAERAGTTAQTQTPSDLPPTPSKAPASTAPKQPPASKPPKESKPRAEAKPLSREERAAARRRLNLTLAAVGAVILIITFVLLVNLS